MGQLEEYFSAIFQEQEEWLTTVLNLINQAQDLKAQLEQQTGQSVPANLDPAFTINQIRNSGIEYYKSIASLFILVEDLQSALDDTEPPTGEMANSVSRHGITWTFDKEYHIGQFVTGDWWVVGPVTIVNIDPISAEGRNGSMLNPGPGRGIGQGYDATMHNGVSWRPNLNVATQLPLTIQEGSLVSSISRPGTNGRPQLDVAEVLTILREVPPHNAFRPSYSGSDKSIQWTLDDVDESVLEINNPPTAPSEPIGLLRSTYAPGNKLLSVSRMFERVWLDHLRPSQAVYQAFQPHQNGPNYGAQVAEAVGVAALHLLIRPKINNYDKLLVNYIQHGLDTFGLLRNEGGRIWKGAFGFGQGRLLPVLFAGLLLKDDTMLNIRLNHPNAWFGEIQQTFFVPQSHTQYGYPLSLVGQPDWGPLHATEPNLDRPNWIGGHQDYRTCCTASWWWGMIAALELLGLREKVNHEALFEYQKRYHDIQVLGLPRPPAVGSSAVSTRITIGLPWALNAWRNAFNV